MITITDKKIYSTAVETDLLENFNITLKKIEVLRYGENPNQPAALYKVTSMGEFPIIDSSFDNSLRIVKEGKNGLSATNYMDIFRATDTLRFFSRSNNTAVAVMKHLNPCGFALQGRKKTLDETFQLAWNADSRSAFGSVIVINDVIDVATAEAITSGKFVEVVAASEFDEGVMNYFEKKKNLRVVKLNNISSLETYSAEYEKAKLHRDVKSLGMNRFLVQEKYLTSIKHPNDLALRASTIKENKPYVVNSEPKTCVFDDMLTAWYIAIGVKSNAVVFVKDGVTVSVGTGQPARVLAVEQAITKGYQNAMYRDGIKYDPLMGMRGRRKLKSNPFQNAVCSSDAFFPFSDSIDLLARVGVTGVIQPGGSIRDYEVIKAINKYKMSMIFTGERCFSH